MNTIGYKYVIMLAQHTTNYHNVITDQGAKITAEGGSEATRTKTSKRANSLLNINKTI
jgi:hypothetical protein